MANDDYQGIWLADGPHRGKHFDAMQPTVTVPEVVVSDKPIPASELPGSIRVRHAVIDRESGPVHVWAPEGWSEEQIIEALDGLEASNW